MRCRASQRLLEARTILVLAFSGFLTAFGAAATASESIYQAVESPGTLNYLLHLPPGYADGEESYPLLFDGVYTELDVVFEK